LTVLGGRSGLGRIGADELSQAQKCGSEPGTM
jgi:hypothetical protein